jgi:hypothetical protein
MEKKRKREKKMTGPIEMINFFSFFPLDFRLSLFYFLLILESLAAEQLSNPFMTVMNSEAHGVILDIELIKYLTRTFESSSLDWTG